MRHLPTNQRRFRVLMSCLCRCFLHRLLKLVSPSGSESAALSMLLSGSEGLLNVWNNLQQALVACETGTPTHLYS